MLGAHSNRGIAWMLVNLLYHLFCILAEAWIGFKLGIGENFFTGMVVRHWQRLSRAVVESSSLQGFQSLVDAALDSSGGTVGLDKRFFPL